MGKSYCTECGTELVDFAKFCPNCGKKVNDNIPQVVEQNQLVNQSIINYVDLYETKAVRHSRGASYGKKGWRTYSRTSTSTQQWIKLGRGKFTLAGDKCYFIEGGQQRTIDRKKIINVTYYNNTAGIEVSMINRQKSLKFLLPGRDIEDGKRLGNAILNGKINVHIKKLEKDPGTATLQHLYMEVMIHLKC